ncbi:protein SAR DEFICIENT 1-like [Punica granatum]|uniref:Uncharacterized protein n=2 Tax=Punica granatum TaxID=22663 RepID=A0A218VX13_PUNGR|nr:protein SAR DEFICIENT 1-like [Punica granatum]OWM65127.1 hypothetical protein CDL15_Pgr008714 [Punica granatum]PKI43840.1 hypothetical protein CRG98_035674 [Punica granatum]
MAAKRFFSESGNDRDQPPEKRMRTRPSFASIIGEVVMVNSLQHFCTALEPMLRRVVNEEVERGLRRCTRSLTRAPSVRIQALEPSNLQLKFGKNLNLPIFTGSKIVDEDGSGLQILLIEGDQNLPMPIPAGPIKVEIVVLDGDFPPCERSNWTSEEFDSSIVRERSGKRPLLAGDLNITIRNAFASVGEIELTDNSSWIRSRKFRLGARVVPGSYHGGRIREAITVAFVVKDHRGELYKKHYPPRLDDDVWRLEKIGKDGAFHKKLVAEGIKTVQDFLKTSVVDTSKLRAILGQGMSEKTWEATIKHARTCEMGNKHYVYNESNCTIILNPICQVERAIIDGHTYTTRELSTALNRAYIENMVRQAHANWSSLHEFEGLMNETALLTQGEVEDQYPPRNEMAAERALPFQHGGYQSDRTLFEVGYFPLPSNSCSSNNNHVQNVGTNDWQMTTSVTTPVEHIIRYSITEASSDGDLTPRSFMTGS